MKLLATIFLPLVVVCGCGSMQKDWEKTQRIDLPERYHNFRKDHPENPYNAQIEEALERLAYQHAKELDTEAALITFTSQYSNSAYVPSCLNRIEELAFQTCRSLETVEGYETFLKRFPRSMLAAQALERLDPLLFHTAEQKQTEASYLTYLERFPNGKYVNPATDGLINLRIKTLDRNASIQDWEKLLNDYPETAAGRAVRKKREGQLTSVIDQFVDLEESVLRREGSDLTKGWNRLLATDAAFCNRASLFYELNWVLHDRFGEVAADRSIMLTADVQCPTSSLPYLPIDQTMPRRQDNTFIRSLLDEMTSESGSASLSETQRMIDRIQAFDQPDDFEEWSSEYWMILGIAKMKHFFLQTKDSADPTTALFRTTTDSGERELLLAIRLDPEDSEPYMYLGLFYEMRGFLLAKRAGTNFRLASMAVKALIGTESDDPIPSGLLDELPSESLLCLKMASVIWRENGRLDPLFRLNLVGDVLKSMQEMLSE